jgi:hypothetical protein
MRARTSSGRESKSPTTASGMSPLSRQNAAPASAATIALVSAASVAQARRREARAAEHDQHAFGRARRRATSSARGRYRRS